MARKQKIMENEKHTHEIQQETLKNEKNENNTLQDQDYAEIT